MRKFLCLFDVYCIIMGGLRDIIKIINFNVNYI